jgi:hypothetical protein
MGRAVRFGLAVTAFCAASPAVASDFSGFGRVFWWAVVAVGVLIAVVVTVIGRRRGQGTREGALVLSVITAVTFAPALLIHIDDQWIPAPFPALAIAALDGSARLLFPVPVFSIAICAAIMFYLLGGGRTKGTSGDSE